MTNQVCTILVNSIHIVLPQLISEKHQEYLIDMVVSIKANVALNKIYAATNVPITEDVASGKFNEIKIMLLDDVDKMKDTPSKPSTGIVYYGATIFATVVTIAVIALYKTNII